MARRRGLRGAIDGAVAVLGMLLLLAMMVLTFVDVVARYVFSAPVYGAVEIIQFLLAVMVFAGFALINNRNEHIVVELFSGPLARRWPRSHRAVVGLTSLLGMGLITGSLWHMAVQAAGRSTASVVLGVPLSLVIGTMTALCGIAITLLALALIVGPLEQTPADAKGETS